MKIELFSENITDELMVLLVKADPDVDAINGYLGGASILVAKEGDVTIGVAVLVVADNIYELKNIAVHQQYQGQGIAKALISAIKDKVTQLGGSKLYVGTGNSSLSQLALYQKCGFRMERIEKGFFSTYPQDIYENGIPCLDKVILSAEL